MLQEKDCLPGGIRAGGRGKIDLSRVLLHQIDSSGSASCPPAELWGRGQVTALGTASCPFPEGPPLETVAVGCSDQSGDHDHWESWP